jgi:putative hemolysin
MLSPALALLIAATPATPAIANPASVYCVERGGRVEIVNTKKGQIGICVFPNGRRIEEWKLYRRAKGRPRGPDVRF